MQRSIISQNREAGIMNKSQIGRLFPKIAAILFLILGILNIFDGIGKQKPLLSLVGVSLIGCCITIFIPKKTGRNKTGNIMKISMSQARDIMRREPLARIVDVRTADEFRSGHIPKAINIPNETITNVEPKMLPEKSQTILVYCQTGMRAASAARKLAKMGYGRIYNIGGITSWTGDIER